MAYKDCNYYSKLAELTEQYLEREEISKEELLAKSTQILDEELSGAGCDWLAHHFNSSAEYMADNICCGDGMDKTEFDLYRKYAELEIGVFRKHGFRSEADFLQKMLDDAVEAYTQV